MHWITSRNCLDLRIFSFDDSVSLIWYLQTHRYGLKKHTRMTHKSLEQSTKSSMVRLFPSSWSTRFFWSLTSRPSSIFWISPSSDEELEWPNKESRSEGEDEENDEETFWPMLLGNGEFAQEIGELTSIVRSIFNLLCLRSGSKYISSKCTIKWNNIF